MAGRGTAELHWYGHGMQGNPFVFGGGPALEVVAEGGASGAKDRTVAGLKEASRGSEMVMWRQWGVEDLFFRLPAPTGTLRMVPPAVQ